MASNIINSKLLTLKGNVNYKVLANDETAAKGEYAINAKSSLTTLGQTANDVTTLTQGDLNGTETLVDGSDSVVSIGGSFPGLTTQLIGDVSSTTSALTAISGSTIVPGSLKVMIGSGSPEAIAFALNNVTGEAITTIQDNTKAFTTTEFEGSVTKLEKSIEKGIGIDYAESVATLNKSINSLLRTDVGYNISDISITLNSYMIDSIRTLGTVTVADMNSTLGFLISGDVESAARIIKASTGQDEAVITDLLNSLTTDITKELTGDDLTSIIARSEKEQLASKSTTYTIDTSNTSSPKTRPLHGASNAGGTSNEIPNGQIDPAYFTYVNTQEELIAEMRSSTREITTVIAHWTATYTNQDIGSEEVHQWHLDRGWSGNGYHYVIRRDGKLQRARPINRAGAHAGAGPGKHSFNPYTIGISMVGGYNCPSGTLRSKQFLSGESLTLAQMKTFEQFMDAFYDVHPGGQAYGHSDVSLSGKLDPGFDVSEYVGTKFGKYNLTDNPISVGPASAVQITAGKYS